MATQQKCEASWIEKLLSEQHDAHIIPHVDSLMFRFETVPQHLQFLSQIARLAMA